jgi:ketosteroid isomerase-like protein
VIVELDVDGVARKTGNPYRRRYISVITAQPDGIASYREYWNPLEAARGLAPDADHSHRAVPGGE